MGQVQKIFFRYFVLLALALALSPHALPMKTDENLFVWPEGYDLSLSYRLNQDRMDEFGLRFGYDLNSDYNLWTELRFKDFVSGGAVGIKGQSAKLAEFCLWNIRCSPHFFYQFSGVLLAQGEYKLGEGTSQSTYGYQPLIFISPGVGIHNLFANGLWLGFGFEYRMRLNDPEIEHKNGPILASDQGDVESYLDQKLSSFIFMGIHF